MNYYYSGQGSLYVGLRAVDGKPAGLVAVGNVPELTLDIAVTNFEHKESESGDRLIDLVVEKERKATFSFKLENMSIDNLALGLYGTHAVIAGAPVVGEDIVGYIGKRTPLAFPDVSLVVVKGAGGTPTYVVADDYTVDAKNGAITIPVGSDITEALPLEVDYTHGAVTSLQAFTEISPVRYLRFEGLNTVDDSRVIIDIFKAQFDPLTGYGLIVEDIASVDMKGTILADTLRVGVGESKYFTQRNIAA